MKRLWGRPFGAQAVLHNKVQFCLDEERDKTKLRKMFLLQDFVPWSLSLNKPN